MKDTKEMHEKSEKELQANAKNHADIVNLFLTILGKQIERQSIKSG